MSAAEAERAAPAAFFEAWRGRLLEAAASEPILDLACGRGRHALALLADSPCVVALDRDRAHLDALRSAAPRDAAGLLALQADLEGGCLPPLADGRFGGVVVFRYLHRPLMPWIGQALRPGGLLLYETFTEAQRALGWGPKRDAFLLRSGELPELLPGLEVLAYEEGPSEDPNAPRTARLAARRPRTID